MKMRKRKRFVGRKADHRHIDFELQITSLADILIIVLVFLLKSYSTGVAQDVNVPAGVHLPEVHLGNLAPKGINVAVSSSFIEIDGKRILALDSGRGLASLVEFEAFPEVMQAIRNYPAGLTVWIVADEKIPYKTIQRVMNSAARAGHSDLRLAVVKVE